MPLSAAMDPPRHEARERLEAAPRRCPRTGLCPLVSVLCALTLTASSSTQAQEPPTQTPQAVQPVQPVQTDKLLHAGASAAVVDVAWAACAAADQPLWVKLAVSVSAGVVVGLGKEGADALGFGTPDVHDLLFDGFGIGLGVAVALIVETMARPSDRTADGPGP